MEVVVNVSQLRLEQKEVTNIISTVDGRTVTLEEPDPDAPVKRDEIRLRRGDLVDIPVRVFKRLGTSVKRYVPPVPTVSELEALEALEAQESAANQAGPTTKAKGK